MKLTKVSTLTGKENTVELPLTQDEFDTGELQRSRGWLIQQVYPNLNKWDREFLISGITREEWEEIFGTI